MTIPFDVDDATLRDAFLRDVLPDSLAPLEEDRAPRWGMMSAQQMVEHLAWSFEISIHHHLLQFGLVDHHVPPERGPE